MIFEYQVILSVDSVNSYIAWDFSLVQGKINMVLLLRFLFFLCANWHDIPKISFYTKLLFVYCQDIGFSLEFASPTGEKIVSSIVIYLLYSNLVTSDFARSLINLHRPFLS